jgi:hypothetical protein
MRYPMFTTRAGGVAIAYQVVGEGNQTLVSPRRFRTSFDALATALRRTDVRTRQS